MPESPTAPNEVAVFTMILLRCDGRYLLLKRGAHKSFAPGRWTGLGGKVESDELHDLRNAALRELHEEAGIRPEDLHHFVLRRSLLNLRPGFPLTVLLYFTGEIVDPVCPACDEGTLHWKYPEDLKELDIIENTREVIPLLIQDMSRDRSGASGIVTGASNYAASGGLVSVIWSGTPD